MSKRDKDFWYWLGYYGAWAGLAGWIVALIGVLQRAHVLP